ncbi:MAG: gas vesicle protein GvpG [Candidatus Sumerlaeota bacterium]|nr:gas vesicle protein GvpG [Candidatus Sumerlaeota bacterium]
MFLIDDILLSPLHGIFWVVRKVHDAAQQELDSEKDNVTAQLTELYMRLETRQITEEEFNAQEKTLLDRLDRIDKRECDTAGADEESCEEVNETHADGA